MPQRAPAKPKPSTDAASPSIRDRLRQAIVKDLSMQERLLLVLTYVEGMSESEIASVLNLARPQVDAIRAGIENRLTDLVQAA